MPEESLAEVTALPELSSTTESEQMYLITVARAVEMGVDGPVSISKIAGAMGVSVPSANEMIRKLDNRGLLVYEPYRGASLSHAGRHLADQVLRTRRLWATFLAEHLGFSPTDADDQACHLEHATSTEAANRLAAYLGNPESGPLGRPIPSTVVPTTRRPSAKLSELPVGATAEVISVSAAGRTLEFLISEGITAGTQLTVVASGSSGLLVDLGSSDMHLNPTVAGAVEVRPIGGADASA
jgi:DtxR family transcriptional regulator, Mn-dependent transcriptional regulator